MAAAEAEKNPLQARRIPTFLLQIQNKKVLFGTEMLIRLVFARRSQSLAVISIK